MAGLGGMALAGGVVMALERRGVFQGDAQRLPRHVRPHQQVHGDDFRQADQVVVSTGGGEDGLALGTEETGGHTFVGRHVRQQLRAVVEMRGVLAQLTSVGDLGLHQRLLRQPQPRDQLIDRAQHRPCDIVGVDLIAGEQHHLRPLGDALTSLAQPAIQRHQSVATRALGRWRLKAIGRRSVFCTLLRLLLVVTQAVMRLAAAAMRDTRQA